MVTAALAKKSKIESLLNTEKFTEALRVVLPKHLTPAKMVKIALIACSRAPALYECTQASLLQSIMKSAELGLDCTGGVLGEGYLIPFRNNKSGNRECQFIPGYRGFIKLARQSKQIKRIEAQIVYEKDTFEFALGLEQKCCHKPYIDGDRGKIKCVYAIAELSDDSTQLEFMTISDVNKIKARSKAKSSGPWVTDFGEMARKTVVRRLAKYLPLSPELANAFEADNTQFEGGSEVAEDVAVGVEGLKKRIKKVDSSEVAPVEEPEAAEPNEEKAENDSVPETGQDDENTESNL